MPGQKVFSHGKWGRVQDCYRSLKIKPLSWLTPLAVASSNVVIGLKREPLLRKIWQQQFFLLSNCYPDKTSWFNWRGSWTLCTGGRWLREIWHLVYVVGPFLLKNGTDTIAWFMKSVKKQVAEKSICEIELGLLWNWYRFTDGWDLPKKMEKWR